MPGTTMGTLLEDDPVALVGDQDVAEPADLVLLPQHGIVHLEVALVVGGEGPGEVVVQGPAGGDDEVDHVVLDHVDDDAAGSSGHDAGREGQDLEAVLVLDHGLGDVGGVRQLLGGESSGASHGLEHLLDGHSLLHFDVLNGDQFELVFRSHLTHWASLDAPSINTMLSGV